MSQELFESIQSPTTHPMVCNVCLFASAIFAATRNISEARIQRHRISRVKQAFLYRRVFQASLPSVDEYFVLFPVAQSACHRYMPFRLAYFFAFRRHTHSSTFRVSTFAGESVVTCFVTSHTHLLPTYWRVPSPDNRMVRDVSVLPTSSCSYFCFVNPPIH